MYGHIPDNDVACQHLIHARYLRDCAIQHFKGAVQGDLGALAHIETGCLIGQERDLQSHSV